MSASENKQILRGVFEEMGRGNTKPFGEILADDVCWTITGTSRYSKTYEGKQAVYEELLKPVFSQFAGEFTSVASRFIAEDDYVVVESRGRAATKTGKEYDNEYCYVFRLADGKVREITEYFDAAMVERMLE